ncbi:MAG TPA: 4-hydroxy-tetrahydrodipicolinate reductase [Fimbriimonadaceae bacterium]|nr:4-hydroxy-tetrahydrodipicolinate reductase [Fimbriimonadaceae bacterium]
MSDASLRIGIVGACGRMGQEVVRTFSNAPGFELVLAVDRSNVGIHLREIGGEKAPDLLIRDKLGAALDDTPLDVLVDFTHPSAAAGHALSALRRKVSPIIGTTGLSNENIRELTLACQEEETAGMYVPNFAIGAVLMMKFCEIAAQWLPDAEIVEMHHDQKEDAPSGTAIRTAEVIGEARSSRVSPKPRTILKVEGARGGLVSDTPIHSVRLKGLLAHQLVIFGGQGEVLSIRHDSMDRQSFMQGVKLCASHVRSMSGFVVGMDKVLFA